jgi:hypothetical protein
MQYLAVQLKRAVPSGERCGALKLIVLKLAGSHLRKKYGFSAASRLQNSSKACKLLHNAS